MRWRIGHSRRDVPVRRSLLVRLLAVSALVSVCSITATAWVVVRSTAVALRQEQGRAFTDDATVYDGLVGYAATHRDWAGAGHTVEALAARIGHRIVLLDKSGATLADSHPEPGRPYRPHGTPTAVIDPLSVDPELLPASATDGIDPRAVGPFRLTADERAQLRATAARVAVCLRTTLGVDAQVQVQPSGRPKLIGVGDTLGTGARCAADALDRPTATEAEALRTLNSLVDRCLAQRGASGVELLVDGGWQPRSAPSPRDAHATRLDTQLVTSCLTTSRSQQLAPYVAPAARLYVASPGRTATTFLDLSTGNKLRIAGGAALVLLVTVAVTTLAGVRLVRPLRALTQAAQRMADGESAARVRVSGGDEIARLSTVFNAMAARREQLEAVRKAMVSDVAHELRTPLSNIRGWLEAAEDGVVRPDKELLSSLLEQALHLQHIIDDLRDLSAADAGELRLTMETVDVSALLSATALAHRAGAEAAGVAVRVLDEGTDDGVVVTADPVRLRQAVGNLVSNAIRHTPRRGSVTLRSHCVEGEAVIEVADTGTGIAPEDLPRVFDRFWRAEKSRGRRGGGSGLGLAIVRKLMEAHGGSATATSEVGSGSRFVLRLPGGRGGGAPT